MNKNLMKYVEHASSTMSSKTLAYFPFLAAFFFSLLFALSVMRYLSEIDAVSGMQTFVGW